MNSSFSDGKTEKEEIEFIFGSLFSDKILNENMRQQYVSFGQSLPLGNNEPKISVIVKKELDVEAIEYFLRFKNRNNILTKKIHALMYLIEVQEDFYPVFHSDSNSFIKGFSSLVYYTLRSIYKLFKGFILVKCYGII